MRTPRHSLPQVSIWGLVFALCLVVGSALRLTGFTRGVSDFVLPEHERPGMAFQFYHFHPDEKTLVDAALRPVDLLDPPLTAYGVLPVYALRGALLSGSAILGWTDVGSGSPEARRRLFLVARGLAVLCSCLVLAGTWLLARHCCGPVAACLAAVTVAFSAGAIQQAHFFIIDGVFALLSLCTVYAVLRASETEGIRWSVTAGILAGAATAVRLNGALLGLLVLVGPALVPEATTLASRLRGIREVLGRPRQWLAVACSLAVALGLQPFILTRPGILLQEGGTQDFSLSVKIARGEILQPWTLVDVHSVPFLSHWVDLWPLIVGWPMAVVFTVAVVFGAWRPARAIPLILLWIALYLGPIATMHTRTVRYIVPLLPFLAILAGSMVSLLYGWSGRRRWLRTVCVGVGLGVMGYTTAYGIAFSSIYLREDPRIRAGRWISNSVPPGSAIGVEGGAFSLAAQISRKRYRAVTFDIPAIFYAEPYLLCSVQSSRLESRMGAMDYIAITDVNRHAQFTAVPDLFPVLATFYERLLNGQLGFDVVERFDQYPEILGLGFGDDGVEPSFLGYDHPSVFVLKRRSRDEWSEAVLTWRGALAENPHCIDSELSRATALLRADDLRTAEVILDSALSSHPEILVTHFLKEDLHRSRGEAEAAQAMAARRRPENLGGSLAHVAYPGSIHHVTAAVASSLVELGMAELAVRVLREEVGQYRHMGHRVLEARAQDYLNVSHQLFLQGRERQMVEAVNLALKVYPTSRAYNILAAVAAGDGDHPRAIGLWERSLSTDAAQAQVHLELARSYAAVGTEAGRVSHHVGRAIAQDPTLSDSARALLQRQLSPGGRP